MREILFRGKRKDNAEWVYGNFVRGCVNDFAYIVEFGNKELCRNYVEVIPSTVGQSTGLTDKHDKKIFKDDIVIMRTASCEVVGYISYSIKFARFVCMTESKISFPLDNTFEYDVIGNIHDNPRFIKGCVEE